MFKSNAVRMGLCLSVCLVSVEGFAAGFGMKNAFMNANANANANAAKNKPNVEAKNKLNTDMVSSMKITKIPGYAVSSSAPKSAKDCFNDYDSQLKTYNKCIVYETVDASSPVGKLKAAVAADKADSTGMKDEVLNICKSLGFPKGNACMQKIAENQTDFCGKSKVDQKKQSCEALLGQEKDAAAAALKKAADDKAALCSADQNEKNNWTNLVATGVNTVAEDNAKIAAAQKTLDTLKSDLATHQTVLKHRQAEELKAIDKQKADGCK